jgi:signal transduction histidine kinase/ActR/RegA family two-component response regulator
MFGKLANLVGRDFDDVLHILWSKEYADEIAAIFRHTLETGEPYATPERIERRRDREVTEIYQWEVHRIVLPSGRYGVVCYFRDVSAQVQARALISEANEALRETDRRKDEFLAMLGHELRNPLSAVRNAVATASLDASRRDQALEIARRQADQLGRLIDDLLDVARITRGRITLRKEHLYLNELLERAIESVRPMVEERGHRLSVTLPAEAIRVDADAARVEQVVVNLLTNAAKYTEPGGSVSVVAERQGAEVFVRVRDTGIGIAPEMLPRVFELFAQADRALDRAQGGLGIGLTVAKRLMQLHGGDLEAHSAGVGEGAEFVMRLPALPPAREDIPLPAARSVSRATPGHARVLMVEDNPDAAESLVMILELLGHRVRVVHDGIAAIDAARANPPDLMLIDIGLPGLDGYEVARRIRRDPTLNRVVLVALTGYGRAEDKERSLAAGFDYHLVKPVDLDALSELVGRLGLPVGERKEPSTVH